MALELYKNTLVTLDEAELYFDERFGSDDWIDESKKPDNSIKEKLLLIIPALLVLYSKASKYILRQNVKISNKYFINILHFLLEADAELACLKTPGIHPKISPIKQ